MIDTIAAISFCKALFVSIQGPRKRDHHKNIYDDLQWIPKIITLK